MAPTAMPAGAPWRDPQHLGVGRLPMRVPLEPYDDAASARAGDPSPWTQSLDGSWAFALVDRPDDITDVHVAAATDETGWDRIAVPGCWTVQGHDRPHYTNVVMPFPGPPPAVPDANPTGVYRRSFRLPTAWRGRRVHLEVGGAESVLYVWCNGTFVGSGTDSRLSSTFDLTPFVRRGANSLVCVVVRWSAHSYVEDQDHWWMAGLHRRVRLVARPPVHLADVRLTPSWGDGGGRLGAEVEVAFGTDGPEAGWRVDVDLEDLRGRRVGARQGAAVPHVTWPYVFAGHVATAEAAYPTVQPWSAEAPTRYRVLVSLVAPDGQVREVVSQVVGFRSVAVHGGVLQVNGRPITVRGVNRHDHHPDRGKAVTLADMREDLLVMKRHNVNAVRTSHYPNDPRFLDLCDELGLYVVDEANLEAHAYNESLCHDPRYRATWIERGARMVARDRNHPSVILWSLGNESGYGAAHDALAAWIRRSDPTRPLHYEGGIAKVPGDPSRWAEGAAVTDVVCPMYASVEDIVAWAEAGPHDRPLILCEYSHAMGNSNGGLADYWDAFGRHRQLQGGFLWEWKDHGLRQRLPDGRVRLAYGGQFGDEPNDANFVADGLCSADLDPHPAMTEVAWVHRPVAVRLQGDRLVVENREAFRDTSWLRATWQLLVDGRVTRQGRLTVPAVEPGRRAAVPLPVTRPRLAPGQEAHLTVTFTTRSAAPWAPAGTAVAWDQVALGRGAALRPGRPAPTPVEVEDDGTRISLAAGSLRAEVDRAGGHLTGLSVGGVGLLAGPLRLELWRAPTDNDGLKVLPVPRDRPLARWRALGLDLLERRCERVEVVRRGGTTVVVAHHVLQPAAGPPVRHRQELVLTADGLDIRDEVDVPEELSDLPRLGCSLLAPARLHTVRWFGLGPGECYPDRWRGATLGRFEAPVDELPYLMPQEFGLRGGVREWSLHGDGGPGLRIAAVTPTSLWVSATHHTAADLTAATELLTLRRRDEVVVHVDVAHRGLGTASCGPDTAPAHRLRAGTWRWRWRLGPGT